MYASARSRPGQPSGAFHSSVHRALLLPSASARDEHSKRAQQPALPSPCARRRRRFGPSVGVARGSCQSATRPLGTTKGVRATTRFRIRPCGRASNSAGRVLGTELRVYEISLHSTKEAIKTTHKPPLNLRGEPFSRPRFTCTGTPVAPSFSGA